MLGRFVNFEVAADQSFCPGIVLFDQLGKVKLARFGKAIYRIHPGVQLSGIVGVSTRPHLPANLAFEARIPSDRYGPLARSTTLFIGCSATAIRCAREYHFSTRNQSTTSGNPMTHQEVRRGQPYGTDVDIYALGCVVFETCNMR